MTKGDVQIVHKGPSYIYIYIRFADCSFLRVVGVAHHQKDDYVYMYV